MDDWIAIMGNCIKGYRVYGPFLNEDEAELWAATQPDTCVIQQLIPAENK